MEPHHRLAARRRRLERRRAARDVEVPLAGVPRAITLTVPAAPDAVLDEVAAAACSSAPAPAELRLPYWATVWASGLALAEAVIDRRSRVAGRRVVELGCGLGTTAVAALAAGADLLVVDCFPEALAYCAYNAARNTGRTPRALRADWRTTAGRQRIGAAGPFDLVLAADVLYEPEDVAPLLELVPDLLVPGGVLWLAEPGRTTSAAFVAAAAARGWHAETRECNRDWPAGAGRARVRLHVFEPIAAGSAGRGRGPMERSRL